MVRTVVAGLDGSPESRAAVEWAAREAELRDLALKIVHVREPVPEPMAQAPLVGGETMQHWTERVPRESAEGVRLRHPGLVVSIEQPSGRPAEALAMATQDAELIVLGSRAMGGIGGFMVGSVGLSVVAHAVRPVVLVRAGEQAAEEHEPDPAGVSSAAEPFRPVVLGLDTGHPDETLLEFAFDTAVRRGTSLTAVHGWNPPPYYAYGMPGGQTAHSPVAEREAAALTEVLRPWRQKYPDVEVIEECRFGSPAPHLVDASAGASLVVVGRRVRRSHFGNHIGHVTHAVLHHSAAPVAVVAHS